MKNYPLRGNNNSQMLWPSKLKRAYKKKIYHLKNIKTFATPRRLAVLVSDLQDQQAAQTVEKHGPMVSQAYDKNGSPTLACLGFAKSCNTTVEALQQIDTPKGPRLVFYAQNPGRKTIDFLPELIFEAVTQLPLPKSMRWGNESYTFIRPVHWLVALYGTDVIPLKLFGINATRATHGHRFHHPKSITLHKADDYAVTLYSQGYVIADFDTRKKTIVKQMQLLQQSQEQVIENDALLNTVTGLVEWPVALKGQFDPSFLSIPKEVLITAMETHQKCFALSDASGDLLPRFLLISNIESKDPHAVIQGNERVIRARLSDAKFFFEQDQKTPLTERVDKLNNLVFQHKLGSLGDKTKRIAALAGSLLNDKKSLTALETAAHLCKADLVTEMVVEFPNLQGVMGAYYATAEGYENDIALAIREHYLPRFSGDQLPSSTIGCCLAIADRIDTLIGIIGIQKSPTGDKDPFALRRAALGVIRIMIEKNLDCDLSKLLKKAAKQYQALPNKNVIQETHDFILARLKSWYLDQGLSMEIFEAVNACHPCSLVDFNNRVKAVLTFQKLPEALSLSAANKRVNNILKKQKNIPDKVKKALFNSDAEVMLSHELFERSKTVESYYKQADYTQALTELSSLKTPIDQFFDDVMIMVDDEKIKQNRLALLAQIRLLLSKVADLSLLP